jgi:hypothetical protein
MQSALTTMPTIDAIDDIIHRRHHASLRIDDIIER